MPSLTVNIDPCQSPTATRRWIASAAMSLSLHGIVFAAVIVSVWGEADELAKFAGQNQAITVEAAWSEAVPPTVVIEEVNAPAPVEITPSEARIEKRRFRETRTATVSLAAVEFAATSEAPTVEAERYERSPDSSDVMAETAEPAPEVNRRSFAKPPATNTSVATPSQLLGNDPTEPPRFVQNRPPHYPDLARQRGWQGTVLLELAIDETGRVTRVDVLRSSGFSLLDAEAVNAVRQWQALPARRAGRPVATIERLPVRFTLE